MVARFQQQSRGRKLEGFMKISELFRVQCPKFHTTKCAGLYMNWFRMA